MRKIIAAAPLFILLAACGGGGGGGVGSTPAPLPGPAPTPGPTPAPTPTPAPVNSSLADLKVSQTFQNDAAGMAIAVNTDSKEGISGSLLSDGLTVRYDATAKAYVMSAGGRSESYTSDAIHTRQAGVTVYKKSGGSGSSALTTSTGNYAAEPTGQYAGLTLWQTNTVSGSRQDSTFHVATYGLTTPASAMPRTGSAGFWADMYGAVSQPGQEPRTFRGLGGFDVDFGTGVFETRTYLTETGLLTPGLGSSGGGILLESTGYLSSSDGTYAGRAQYRGSFGEAVGNLSGRFYGPAAQETGGVFSGANGSGLTVVGGFTGSRYAMDFTPNLTVAGLASPEDFRVFFPDSLAYDGLSSSVFQWRAPDTFRFAPTAQDALSGDFTPADKVASNDPNFTRYQSTLAYSGKSQDVTLKFYRPGSGNSELALTYASFVHYSGMIDSGSGPRQVDQIGGYGFSTPFWAIAGRTGTGSYQGIVYGVGRQSASGALYDVKGASRFAVDFGAQSYTGALAMTGAGRNGGGTIDFGNYDVIGRYGANQSGSGTLARGGTDAGSLWLHFYGPSGEEIVAPFSLTAPPGAAGAGIRIEGVAAAKRQ